jgi:Predicted transcriptional regulator
MTVDEIIEGLKIRGGNTVANATGISFVTISRIKNGHRRGIPRYDTLEKLSRYMKDNPEEVEVLRARLAQGGGA